MQCGDVWAGCVSGAGPVTSMRAVRCGRARHGLFGVSQRGRRCGGRQHGARVEGGRRAAARCGEKKLGGGRQHSATTSGAAGGGTAWRAAARRGRWRVTGDGVQKAIWVRASHSPWRLELRQMASVRRPACPFGLPAYRPHHCHPLPNPAGEKALRAGGCF
jgi:hypothetical protein